MSDVVSKNVGLVEAIAFWFWPSAAACAVAGLMLFIKTSGRRKALGRAALLLACALFGLGWAVPWYAKAVTSASKISCIANLKQIEAIKATWALENKKENLDVPKETDLFGEKGYVREKPVCHGGGTYTLGLVGDIPTCSLGVTNEGHRLP